MGITVAVSLALLVGFVAGFVLFKRSQRWCPGCGATITPAHCPDLMSAERWNVEVRRACSVGVPSPRGGAT